MGVLGWSERQFWHSSFYAIRRALRGWRDVNGLGQKERNAPAPLSKEKCDELHDMMLRFEAQERKKQRNVESDGH